MMTSRPLACGPEAVSERLPAGRRAAITPVRAPAWLSIGSCVVNLLHAGVTPRSDRRTAVTAFTAVVVAEEALVFAGNLCRCPLTQPAQRLGVERGGVTDIWLPRCFAHDRPASDTSAPDRRLLVEAAR